MGFLKHDADIDICFRKSNNKMCQNVWIYGAVPYESWTWKSSVQQLATGCKTHATAGTVLFTAASRLALGSTEPPVQWTPRLKRAECEADRLPSNAEIKDVAVLTAQCEHTRATSAILGTINRMLRNATARQTTINVIYRPKQHDNAPAMLQSTGSQCSRGLEYVIRKENWIWLSEMSSLRSVRGTTSLGGKSMWRDRWT
jgi:hypothetical protein